MHDFQGSNHEEIARVMRRSVQISGSIPAVKFTCEVTRDIYASGWNCFCADGRSASG